MSNPGLYPPEIVYAFGPFCLDLSRGLLLREGEPVSLPPKLFDTLLVFVKSAGRIVSREVLTDKVWPDTIVSDTSISQNIFLLRKILGDEAIETVPRRGYRFTLPVVLRHGRAEAKLEVVAPVVEEPGVGATPASEIEPAQLRARSRYAIAFVAAIAVALAAGWSLHAWRLQRRTAFARDVMTLRKQLAIVTAPFVNERRSAGDAWMRTALPRMLSDHLAGDRVRIAPNEAAIRMPIELQLAETTTYAPETALRIGRYAKADLILCGSFVALGDDDTDDFELTARVQDVRSGEVIAVASSVGSKARLFALVQNVAADLRQQLGLAVSPPEEQRRVEHLSVPANLEAARLYARGVEELHRYNLVAARDLLLGAEKADPKYALTHRALCDVWTKLANNTGAQQEATLALQYASDLPRAQQLEIEALHGQTYREFAKAIETRKTLANFYPENVEYALDLVSTYFAAQKLPEALEAVRALRARNLAPDDPRVDFAEANVHLEMGSWADALRLADLAAGRLRNGGSQVLLARSLSVKATALQRKGDDGWRQTMEECLTVSRKAGYSAGVWRALQTLAVGYADDEQPEKAIPLLRAAEQEAVRAGDTRMVLGSIGNLAYAYNAAGRWNDAKQAAERALPLARAASDANNETILLSMLAHRALGVGDLEEAKRLSEEALRGATAKARKSGIAANLATLGRISLMRGRLGEARAQLGESLKVFTEIAAKRGIASVSVVLASVAFEEGKLEEARKLLAGIDSDEARLLLARIDIEQGRAREALTRLATDPTSGEAQALRALAAARLGDGDEAGRLAAESLRLVKPSLLYHDLMSMRIDAACAAGAVDRLDDVARDATRNGDVLVALSARAARCELTRAGCGEVAREARAHGLLRLARRVRSAGASALLVTKPTKRSRE